MTAKTHEILLSPRLNERQTGIIVTFRLPESRGKLLSYLCQLRLQLCGGNDLNSNSLWSWQEGPEY